MQFEQIQNRIIQNKNNEITIKIVNNMLLEADFSELSDYFTKHDLGNSWVIDESLKLEQFSLKKLMLNLCDYKLFIYESEVIDKKLISFTNVESKKYFIIQTDICLNINNCSMMEFTDSLQLLFNPEITEISFSNNEGDLLNCFISIKLDVD